MGHPFSSDDIEATIDEGDSHISRADLDDLLLAVQEDLQDNWNTIMEGVERGDSDIVAEYDDAIVIADHTGGIWQQQLDAVVEFADLLGVEDEETPEIVLAVHRHAAHRLTEEDWSTANPVVVAKPDEPRGGS